VPCRVCQNINIHFAGKSVVDSDFQEDLMTNLWSALLALSIALGIFQFHKVVFPGVRLSIVKKLTFFFLLFSASAFAKEPIYIYQQFGYAPPAYDSQELSQSQQTELDDCIKFAKERNETSKKNAEKMAAIYGPQALQYDYVGVHLTACLADEKTGKGWMVYEKRGNEWTSVRSRYALRKFMKLDPAQ
jgi:hypothetical protein